MGAIIKFPSRYYSPQKMSIEAKFSHPPSTFKLAPVTMLDSSEALYSSYHHFIRLTMNRAICGKAIKRIRNTRQVTQKGIEPRNTVPIEMPFGLTIWATTKRYIPTGGVSCANSNWTIARTPNHRRSISYAISTGRKIGMVSISMGRGSMGIPIIK